MILIFKHVIPKQFIGLTIWPFVFLKSKDLKKDPILINHEAIHLKQQLELLIVPFFLWYGVEFLLRLVQYKDWYTAYRNISFEREAYYREDELDYVERRKFWSFLSFL